VGTNIGTVTNADGEFTLKISKNLNVDRIQLSHVGYYNTLVMASRHETGTKTYYLMPESRLLSEVQVFSWHHPRDLVREAMSKIKENYPMTPNMMTGFYRETIQKRRKYINISEAVIEIYKSAYSLLPVHDQVKVLKGRKLISPKKSDTLSVKFIGGPNMSVYLDIVKNPDVFFDEETLNCYTFSMGEMTMVNDRPQFVVLFEPAMIMPYPLYSGTLYIDRETLSFTRAEFSMDMSNKQKVTETILRDKPAGLRFTPEEVLYTVSYRQSEQKTYLNYIRNEIRFKCDWKRRLFATNYTVQGETVITDRNEDPNIKRIPAKETFSIRHSLSQEVGLYQDENFWSNYNIIEPTESLESAVNKLEKQILKSQ
jgi:hypothetical protein